MLEAPEAGAPTQERMRQLLLEAVRERVFPGASVGILRDGCVRVLTAAGRFTYDPASSPVLTNTSFDLASVSKVVATTAMAMLLWQRRQLDLDMLVADLLPGFVIGSGDSRRRRAVTFRMLLAHASGLPVHLPLFERASSPTAMMREVLRVELAGSPGTRTCYSDIGFILLGKALEVLAGERMDTFCQREIFLPLGMEGTQFCLERARRLSVPPTEERVDLYDGQQRQVQGEVHDENCLALGGICGHAGLFAPPLDLLRFAEALLLPFRPGAKPRVFRVFTGETVLRFTARAALPPGSSRALGWDTPSGSPPSAGRLFSPESFGHLGFTGTSLWIDPKQDLAVVLLSNRTFPRRENRAIQDFRPRLHDLAVACSRSSTSG